MATIPMIRNKNDAFYRYQMPKLIAKIEGSGNGIRTVITNMALIAKAINRPGTYVTKFFGYELGAQVKTDASIYSVNGSHDPEKLLSLLYSFIEKFVLCSNCANPETDLSVTKKQISLKCKACGSTTTINERTHKLTTFIVNHYEDASNGKKESKSKSKKSKKGDEKSSGDKKNSDGSSKTANLNRIAGGDDDGDDFSGNDEELVVPDQSINALAEELESTKLDNCEKFYEIFKEKLDANQLSDVKIQKDLLNESVNLGIRDKSSLVLCKALFDENILEQIKTHEKILQRFCYNNPKAQKYLLGGFERIIEMFSKLLPNTAKILKEFYDRDILDERVLIEWYEKPSKKYVTKDLAKTIREKAFPLIKWLKEAEEEDDDDDDEEEDKNGSGSGGDATKKPTTTITTTNGNGNTKSNNNNKQPQTTDEDDEDDTIGFSHKVSGIKVETVKPKEEEVDDSFIDDI